MSVFQLSTIDYVVIGVCCMLSSCAGLYFTLCRKKQDNFYEYFLASRSTHILPIILSYYATITTSSGSIGAPVELYLYGTQMLLGIFLRLLCVFLTNAIFLPLLYQMNSPNCYKYLQLRYGTIISRLVISLNILQQLGTASVHLYAIAVSLNSVTTLSVWTYVGIISAFVIPYSTFGGIRGIMLADSYQAIIMIFVVFSILIQSILISDGLSTIWHRNYDSGRIELFNFSVDFKLRYTFWTEIAAQLTILHDVTLSQTLQQRVLSASTVANAKKAAIWGMALSSIMYALTHCLGLFMYSYFYSCDPVKSGTINNINQMMSYYVGKIFHSFPGMTGFFFAGLGCSFLSTYSSILNSFAAVFIDGVFHPLFSKLNDKQITKVSKVTVVLFGLLTIGGVQLAASFPTIMQAYLSLTTITTGPVFFIFMIGVLCPQANSKIILYCFLMTFAIMTWIMTGAMLIGVPSFTKPISTDGCSHFTNGTYLREYLYHNLTTPVSHLTVASYFPLSTISYRWYTCFGFLFILLLFIVLNLLFCWVRPPLSSDPGPSKKMAFEIEPKMEASTFM